MDFIYGYVKSKYTSFLKVNKSYIMSNSYSGAICQVDAEMKQRIEDNDFCVEDFVLLKNNGFIVPKQQDEYQKILNEETRILFGYNDCVTVVIAPTLKCNYCCEYCFEPQKKICTMTDEIQHKTIDYIKKLVMPRVKKLMVVWFGGEPLLCMSIIERLSTELIAFCEESNIEYSSKVISNGYLLTPLNVHKLVSLKVKTIQVTLDGKKEFYERIKKTPPNAYETVIKNITYASDLVNIAIRLNVQQKHYSQLYAFLDELSTYFGNKKNVGIYLAEVCQDWHDPNADYQISSYISEKIKCIEYISKKFPFQMLSLPQIRFKGNNCGLIKKSNIVIGPEGELYRCEHMVGRDQEVIGNIEDGLYHNYADQKFYFLGRPEKCKECFIFPVCMSGCPNDVIESKLRINCEDKKEEYWFDIKRTLYKKTQTKCNVGGD